MTNSEQEWTLVPLSIGVVKRGVCYGAYVLRTPADARHCYVKLGTGLCTVPKIYIYCRTLIDVSDFPNVGTYFRVCYSSDFLFHNISYTAVIL